MADRSSLWHAKLCGEDARRRRERRAQGWSRVYRRAHADVIATARNPQGLLVGVSRAITDFTYCTYVADLAVDVAFQRRGIGRDLIRRAHVAAGLHTSLILLAAPKAETYYPHIGMLRHNSCWRIEPQRG